MVQLKVTLRHFVPREKYIEERKGYKHKHIYIIIILFKIEKIGCFVSKKYKARKRI